MRRLFGLSVLVLTTVLLPSVHATVAEIRVVRGSYFQPINSLGELSVEGTDGLRMALRVDPSGSAGGWYFCENLGCPPGDEVSLGAHYTAGEISSLAFGRVTIHGQTYTFEVDGASAEFVFEGSIVLPELTDSGVQLTAPFTFSGSLRVPSRHEPGTFEVYELHGSGVATATLVRHLDGTGWIVASVTYDFEPGRNVTQP